MEFEVIKLMVSNTKIREYKQFEGNKLYSDSFKSDDGKKLTNKRVYVTKKHNYVYYERTDTNWNYWADKKHYNSSFSPEDVEHHIVFEVSPRLSNFIKYLGEDIVEKLERKEKEGELVEILDI